jgi:hypothetical protein
VKSGVRKTSGRVGSVGASRSRSWLISPIGNGLQGYGVALLPTEPLLLSFLDMVPLRKGFSFQHESIWSGNGFLVLASSLKLWLNFPLNKSTISFRTGGRRRRKETRNEDGFSFAFPGGASHDMGLGWNGMMVYLLPGVWNRAWSVLPRGWMGKWK